MVQLAAARPQAPCSGSAPRAIILRTKALTLLMLTLAITSVLLEIANKATTLTGGATAFPASSWRPFWACSGSISSARPLISIAFSCCSSDGGW